MFSKLLFMGGIAALVLAVATVPAAASPTAMAGPSAAKARPGIPPGNIYWNGHVLNVLSKAKVDEVKATWTEPRDTCGMGYSTNLIWVGLGGVNPGDPLVQVGTRVECLLAPYVQQGDTGWYETPGNNTQASKDLPAKYQVNIGDTITADVRYLGNGSYQMSMTDDHPGGGHWTWGQPVTIKNGGDPTSSEVIIEPTWHVAFGIPVYHDALANFGTVTFTDARYWSVPKKQYPVDIYEAETPPQAKVSHTTGYSFTVTWKHS